MQWLTSSRLRQSFIRGTNFPAWMHRILCNRFISDLRRRLETTTIDHVSEDQFATSGGHENIIALKELSNVMIKLPAEQCEVFMLMFRGWAAKNWLRPRAVPSEPGEAVCSGRGPKHTVSLAEDVWALRLRPTVSRFEPAPLLAYMAVGGCRPGGITEGGMTSGGTSADGRGSGVQISAPTKDRIARGFQ